MTKQELIDLIRDKADRVHGAAGTSKKTVEAVLASLTDIVTDAVANGEDVTIPGLGKLTVAEKAARKGRNPKTGAEIDIPAKRVPKFSAAKALKDAVA